MRRLLLPLFVAACAREAKGPEQTTTQASTSSLGPDSMQWAESTQSPWPVTANTREARLASLCGQPDSSLERVAKVLAAERVNIDRSPEDDHVVALLRAHGTPHMRPKVMTASGRTLSEDVVRAQLELMKNDVSRCGVATTMTPSGDELVVTVVVDPVADLAPLPTRTRPGQWLTLDAVVNTRAFPQVEGARVAIMGKRGLPRTVPTTFDRESGRIRAKFALDQRGGFTVQVVVDSERGPHPILESRVFADVAPALEEGAVPGEGAGGATESSDALFRMLVEARRTENLATVVRDPQLDAVAGAHAERMRSVGRAAHVAGEGDLVSRLAGANIAATAVAENVAHARSLVLAHRVLYASPSHRMNILGNYTRVGLGIARASDDSLYVCEVFAR